MRPDDGGAASARIPPDLSAACLGWARTAHYSAEIADDGDIHLRSEIGAPTRYIIRRRDNDRLELIESALTEDIEHPLLFVADIHVMECHLVALFADDIREDLDLPLLELPWNTDELADGFELTEMVRGYRTLRQVNGGPVAAAPDPTLSLLALVPLSHYLRWSIPDIKRSFLNPGGVPLLRHGRYTTR